MLNIIDETLDCGTTTFPIHAELKCYANLAYDISISTGVTLIVRIPDPSSGQLAYYFQGNMGSFESWKTSNIYMRTTGDIVATFVFDAFAKISFTTGQIELFGMKPSHRVSDEY